MFRWNESTTFKFVSEYLKHECLWNVKSPFYKNKQVRVSAYNNLEEIMNISGFGEQEIKLKIKNIRSTYSQELKKIKDSKISGAAIDGDPIYYIPSIKWFNILHDSLRNNTNSITTQNQNNLESTEGKDNEDDRSAIETRPNSSQTSVIIPSKPSIKKQKLSNLKNLVNELKGITEIFNSSLEENEFEVFGKHVGLQLKSLPLLLALDAQEHIQTYLNGIRRRHLINASYSLEDSPYSMTSTCYSNVEGQSPLAPQVCILQTQEHSSDDIKENTS